MANRHLSRSIVLQSLFEWDLNDIDRKEVIEVLDRNIEEFAKNYARHMPLSMRKTGIKFRWAIDENAVACQFPAAHGPEAFVIDGQKSLIEGRSSHSPGSRPYSLKTFSLS